MSPSPRLVVVANRLPVHRVKRAGGHAWEASPGGVVTALAPILRERDGTWVGWPGFVGPVPDPFMHDGIAQVPVPLSQSDLEAYYQGFSNGTLWPLYHDAVRYPEYHRHWWWPYASVNRKFAEVTAHLLHEGDTAWIHDYQLQLVPGYLRELAPKARIGFFQHIPFPPVELFAQLPWRRQILEGLLGADVVGFQTVLGAQNFAAACARHTEAELVDSRTDGDVLRFRGREVEARCFPISIDVAEIEALAQAPEIIAEAERIREQVDGRRLFLGVDRLDYTKGIDVRLRGFETLLGQYENLSRDAVFVQIAVPSRELVPEYAEMRTRIESQVGRINGNWGEPGRVPVNYLYRSVPREELIAYYLAADIMAVTPLRDGMNLVAKEYVASRLDDSGVLILSEFAGAAFELNEATLVNPHDIDGIARAFEEALDLDTREGARRMAAMREQLRSNDVHSWASGFLESLSGE